MLDTRDRQLTGDLDHADQYRMLREEILEQVRDTRRLETLTLGALAIFYTWVLTHGAAAGGRGIYWIALRQNQPSALSSIGHWNIPRSSTGGANAIRALML